MFIAIKDTKIIAIYDSELGCRRKAKGLSKIDFNTWVTSVTTEGVPDFSGEDYEIVEIYSRNYESTDDDGNTITIRVDPLSYESTDEDGRTRTITFHESGHIHQDGTYSLKWDASKKEVVKDDTAKAAWELAEEWKRIRKERTRLLSESDWTQGGDSPLTTQKKSDWAKYRTSLRTLPEDQSSKTKYSDITWPTKPS